MLSSEALLCDQAERTKGELIARMDEEERRDNTTVPILHSKGKPW